MCVCVFTISSSHDYRHHHPITVICYFSWEVTIHKYFFVQYTFFKCNADLLAKCVPIILKTKHTPPPHQPIPQRWRWHCAAELILLLPISSCYCTAPFSFFNFFIISSYQLTRFFLQQQLYFSYMHFILLIQTWFTFASYLLTHLSIYAL